jgi:hypothetical protein
MIKAEILTNLGARHVITLTDDLGFADLAEAHQFIVKALLDDGVFSNDVTQEYLEINCRDEYQYIRLWREDYVDPNLARYAALQQDANATDEDPWEFSASVNFLGQKGRVKGLATTRNGKTFYMPLTVGMAGGQGDIPALEAMGIDTLKTCFGHYLKTTGQLAEAVVPPFMLTGSEAAAFLVDYAQQAEPDPVRPGERNAQAAGRVFDE